jgi:predicted nucleotidyltransferase
MDQGLSYGTDQNNIHQNFARNPDRVSCRSGFSPTAAVGSACGTASAKKAADLNLWARRDGRGLVFDSSTGFNLPNGATRAPAVAWVRRERIEALSAAQRRGFLPLAPDLVIEFASPTPSAESWLHTHADYDQQRVATGCKLGQHPPAALLLADTDMRLTAEQIQGIRRIARQLAGEEAEIRVFGSRLDHRARGGDLDLLLELPGPIANPALLAAQVSAQVSRLMDGRKVDVVLVAPNLLRLPIHEVALKEGQPL